MENDPHILVVEDTTTQALRIQHSLQGLGFKVRVATNAREGLSMLAESRPQAILSDINMPEMDGYEFSKIVKATDQYRDIPLILLSAIGDAEDILRIVGSGADSFLQKQFNGGYLPSRLSTILATHRARAGDADDQVTVSGPSGSLKVRPQQTFNMLLSAFDLAVMQNKNQD